jgi:O-antigen/teichoic acid export membrane protein
MEASPAEGAAPPLTLRERIGAARRSGTAKAAGLAAATIAQQVLAVVFTVVFTRILGTDGYGSLAALLNLTVILLVPGSALQVAAARQGTLGRLGRGGELAATLDRWTRHLLAGLAAVAVVSVLAREPLAAVVNVDETWAAAAVPVAAGFWLILSVQRGLLQAAQAYRPVALSILLEGLGRIVVSLALVGVGLDVTGAFLGTLAAWIVASAALWAILRRRLGPPARDTPKHPLTALARSAAVPIAGLVLVAALQNVDVIMARHALAADPAGVYAATTVAAKFIVWLAVGIGMWVLPEAIRRAAAGHDPRGVLVRGLVLIVVLAIPALALFAAIPGLLLRTAFGADYESGDAVLLPLGVAFAFLACTYVAVQFMLGLHRRRFIAALAVAAIAEPILLASADTLETFAVRVLIVQAAAAVALLALGARVRRDPLAGSDPLL